LNYKFQDSLFVVVYRFYILTTKLQLWGVCAFCNLSLKRHTNSFATVGNNNSMRYCCCRHLHRLELLRQVQDEKDGDSGH